MDGEEQRTGSTESENSSENSYVQVSSDDVRTMEQQQQQPPPNNMPALGEEEEEEEEEEGGAGLEREGGTAGDEEEEDLYGSGEDNQVSSCFGARALCESCMCVCVLAKYLPLPPSRLVTSRSPLIRCTLPPHQTKRSCQWKLLSSRWLRPSRHHLPELRTCRLWFQQRNQVSTIIACCVNVHHCLCM